MWRDAVEQFRNIFEVGKVYYISKATVKPANKRFVGNSNYVLDMRHDTIVQPAPEDGSIAPLTFQFQPLTELRNAFPDAVVDVLGIVIEIEDSKDITTRAGKSTSRRNIIIGDQSGVSIQLSIWGENAKTFEPPLWSAIVAKGVRVSDFNEKSLSTGFSSTLHQNPNLAESQELLSWFSQHGANIQFEPLSQTCGGGGGGGGGDGDFNNKKYELKTLAQMKEDAATAGTLEPIFFNVKATTQFFRKENNVYYIACSGNNCQKKLTPQGGQFYCENCHQICEEPNVRYILSCNIMDYTGELWLCGCGC
jgi:replication factor A1